MTDPGVVVERVRMPDATHVEALGRLLPQLSSSAEPLTLEDLRAILTPGAGVTLLAARLPAERSGERAGAIVGFAVLAVFTSLTGTRGWLEDVVVDGEARNRGVGRQLVEAIVEAARAAGCRTLDLTSRPSRVAANRLYERCGFARRETNVYRLDLRA